MPEKVFILWFQGKNDCILHARLYKLCKKALYTLFFVCYNNNDMLCRKEGFFHIIHQTKMKEVSHIVVYFIFEIILCFFAIVGFVCTVFWLFDLYTAKKSGIALDIYIRNVDDKSDCEHCEYAVRILESVINHTALYGITKNIVISEKFFPDEMFEKLSAQYKNLRKEE